jgi:hypothetical protein
VAQTTAANTPIMVNTVCDTPKSNVGGVYVEYYIYQCINPQAEGRYLSVQKLTSTNIDFFVNEIVAFEIIFDGKK